MMATKLNAEQERVLRAILREGRRKNASPRELKAAIETGLVEANLTNPGHGDRDSVGWRQERSHYGPQSTRMNVQEAARRFFDEADQLNDEGGSAGALAQRVQRSAFPGRYQQQSGRADELLRRYGGKGSGDGQGPSRPSSSTQTIPGTDRSGDRRALLASYLSSSQQHEPGGLLELRAGLKASADTPARKVRVRAQQLDKDDLPTRDGDVIRGAKGKVIGTPHSGTHTLGNWQSDNAVDLGAREGSVVQMPKGGVIEKVSGGYEGGSSRFDGFQVTARLDDGRRIFLTHLAKTHVKPGQRLRAGQAVGRVGKANSVEHLHAGVDRGDPRKLFAR